MANMRLLFDVIQSYCPCRVYHVRRLPRSLPLSEFTPCHALGQFEFVSPASRFPRFTPWNCISATSDDVLSIVLPAILPGARSSGQRQHYYRSQSHYSSIAITRQTLPGCSCHARQGNCRRGPLEALCDAVASRARQDANCR